MKKWAVLFCFISGSLAIASGSDDAVISHFPYISKYRTLGDRCVKCHAEQAAEVFGSIHGKAQLLEDYPKGALCLTCHEVNHKILSEAKAPLDDDEHFFLPPTHDVPCMRCHADPVLAEKFGFRPHVPSEFEESMHFRKVVLGDKKAPLCYRCHGSHNVKRVEDPGSPVHSPEQRVKVCAQCHEGANVNFAMTFDHEPISMKSKPIEYTLILGFKALTLITFLALGFFMLLDMMTLVRVWMFKKEKPHKPQGEEKYVIRMNRPLRIQHFLLFTSVLTLIITGWPLFASKSELAQSFSAFLGGASPVADIHRIAGFVMMGAFIYHIVYLIQCFRAGHREFAPMPGKKDITDLFHMLFYFFGLRSERPRFEKMAFHEKFDYWAVFWGVAMMGGSGLVLMFPVFFARLFPPIVISCAAIIHADEALLAGVVLLIWHFYNVHLKPGVFPMNWAWLTGRMPKHHFEEEHQAYVDRLRREGKWEED